MTTTGPSRRTRAFVLALTLVAVLAAAPLSSGAPATDGSADPAGGGEPRAAGPYDPSTVGQVEPSDLQWMMDQWSITEEQAQRRYTIEDSTIALRQIAVSRWPSSFAGIWIGPGADPTIHLAFTEATSENIADLQDEYAYPELLLGHTAARSWQAVLASREQLLQDRDDLQHARPRPDLPEDIRRTDGAFNVGTDVANDALVVFVEQPSDALEQALDGRYGETILQAGAIGPSACTRADCYPTMRGGIGLYNSGGAVICSSAFAAVGGSGSRYILSAGHCGGNDDDGSQRFNGGQLFGTMHRDVAAGQVDAERIIRSNSNWGMSGEIWEGPSLFRSITSYMLYSQLTVGMTVGKTGVSEGTDRGVIQDLNYAPGQLSWIANNSNFITADYCSRDGDSGGAIFRNNSAVGIHSGGTNFGNTVCPGSSANDPNTDRKTSPGHFSIFGSIEFAIQELSLSLIAGYDPPPPPPTTTTTQPPTTTTTACLVRNPLTGQCAV